jgi:ribosomal protein S18 acetylase RimI-like enzyme
MAITLRPAEPRDFEFCARLYSADLALYIPDPADQAAKLATLQPRWHVGEVRIVVRDGTDIGWLQSTTADDDAVFIVQFFIDAPLRGRAIGADVLAGIIAEATSRGRDVTLEVVKENRALRLYRRLGFEIVGEDGAKYHMRRSSG